jgi:hypothetical protein
MVSEGSYKQRHKTGKLVEKPTPLFEWHKKIVSISELTMVCGLIIENQNFA